MKSVVHICQQPKGMSGAVVGSARRFDSSLPEQTMTLPCTRWSAGRKLRLKVLINDAAEKAN
jgi:hypothetical protein